MRTFAVGQRRAMVENAVARRGASIALACRAFGVSETCYRYGPKLRAENEEIGVCQRCCAPISCGVSDFRGADFGFWVEPDGSGGLPVAGFACPAFWFLRTCICIENGSVCQRCAVMVSVACARGDEANGAVQMLAVIPTGEGFHPSLSICFCGKALARPVRAVFAGSEQSLREGIIIADARAAALSRSWTSQPTILRLKMSTIRYR
jgi:hypothetical protein